MTSDGDILTVRNTWGTRIINRDDVEGFHIRAPAAGGFPWSKAILVLLRDQTALTLNLDVTRSDLPTQGAGLSGGSSSSTVGTGRQRHRD